MLLKHANKMAETWKRAAVHLQLGIDSPTARAYILIDGIRRDLDLSKLSVPSNAGVVVVSKFYGAYDIMSKATLTWQLRLLGRAAGQKLEGLPQSFVLPEDGSPFSNFVAQDAARLVICKPPNLNQGRGIFLARAGSPLVSAAVSSGEPMVVQNYIERPLLVAGNKCDLRLYLVVAALDPPRLFLARQGIVRCSAVPYEPVPPGPELGDIPLNLAAHLTNYSLQKKDSSRFEKPNDRGETGHKRSLSWLWSDLAKTRGLSDEELSDLWSSICRLVATAFFSLWPPLKGAAHRGGTSKSRVVIPFQIIGVDVLLEDDGVGISPHLLEVNCSPSLTATDDQGQPSILDGAIKERVAAAALAFAVITAKKSSAKRRTSQGASAAIADERSVLGVAQLYDLDDISTAAPEVLQAAVILDCVSAAFVRSANREGVLGETECTTALISLGIPKVTASAAASRAFERPSTSDRIGCLKAGTKGAQRAPRRADPGVSQEGLLDLFLSAKVGL